MKYRLIWLLVCLVPLAGYAQEKEYELVGLGTRVSGLLDLAFQSEYVWRGFNVYGSKTATQFTAGVNLPEWGPGFLVSGHMANGSGQENFKRLDFSPYYQNEFLSGSPYQTNYRLGYVYYNHPKLPSRAFDMMELHGILSYPLLTGMQGLIPNLALIYMWPASNNSTVDRWGGAEGWLGVFGLDYVFSLPGLVPEIPEQVVKLHSEITYNSGFNPVAGTAVGTSPGGPSSPPMVDSDWSHAIIGGSTDFYLGYSLTLTPYVYYQFSMESTVNTDDQMWATLGLRYSF